MFTGIIEEIGMIKNMYRGIHSSNVTIEGNLIFEDLKTGDSVAVNGICLTASKIDARTFSADVMHETLDRTVLGKLKCESKVNLERAMSASGRFGGHMVSGHIDGTGTITKVRKDDNAVWYTITASEKILFYIIEKGSIAVDGISLTVAKTAHNSFSVSVIPHTAENTVLSDKKTGDAVNLENDIVGKYIEKLIQPQRAQQNKSGITPEFLLKFGF